jgi:hypothetical protein
VLFIGRTLIDKRLVDACVLLLGSPPRRVSVAFIQELDVGTVRRAWRVIAMASHPDAARRSGGRKTALDGRRFVEASQAYQFLMSYLLSRPAHPHTARRGTTERRSTAEHGAATRRYGPERHAGQDRRPGSERHAGARRHAGAEARAGAERRPGSEKRGGAEKHAGAERRTFTERRGGALYYRGPLPHRRLRLAEYLYYSGRVSWQSLISALVWQKASQPRFGELAKDLRSISAQDLVKILGSRLRHEHTGETAQRLQLLSATQVERILRMQRARRRLIGRYFVEKESMSSTLLASLLHELHRHNARWPRS